MLSDKHIVIPEELEEGADILLQGLSIPNQLPHLYGLDLLAPDAPIDYATALDELDIWQEANFWSNSPVLICETTISTKELVDLVPIGSEAWMTLMSIDAQTEARERGLTHEEVIAERMTPVTEQYRTIMTKMREIFRLDMIGNDETGETA